jgi:hypothetical protein
LPVTSCILTLAAPGRGTVLTSGVDGLVVLNGWPRTCTAGLYGDMPRGGRVTGRESALALTNGLVPADMSAQL